MAKFFYNGLSVTKECLIGFTLIVSIVSIIASISHFFFRADQECKTKVWICGEYRKVECNKVEDYTKENIDCEMFEKCKYINCDESDFMISY
uniref:Uncharacterized protein n=1 Tax=Acrobeloides nanus TaxID=290746 RepID=A0A914DJR4_9BILA